MIGKFFSRAFKQLNKCHASSVAVYYTQRHQTKTRPWRIFHIFIFEKMNAIMHLFSFMHRKYFFKNKQHHTANPNFLFIQNAYMAPPNLYLLTIHSPIRTNFQSPESSNCKGCTVHAKWTPKYQLNSGPQTDKRFWHVQSAQLKAFYSFRQTILYYSTSSRQNAHTVRKPRTNAEKTLHDE